MHPTLAAFAASYRHRYPDLEIREHAPGDCLRIIWHDGEIQRLVTACMMDDDDPDPTFVFSEDDSVSTFDPWVSLLEAFAQQANTTILAAPGTFGALVLERRLLRLSAIRPMSPDRLN